MVERGERAEHGPRARDLAPVHVVNGDSVGGTLAHSGLPGEVIVWRDVLHEGRIPPGPPAVVQRLRADFLAEEGDGSPEAIRADLAAADAALIAALDAGRETVLWFEHDLHDQLQLIQILARIAGHPARDAARLISIGSYPGRPRFAGLGELSADQLAGLWPRREPIEATTFAAATRAYDTFRQGDPKALAALAGESHPGLPYLSAALRRLLEERPWATSGLARSERQILRAVAGGAQTPFAVFSATWEMEEAPYEGDSWVFRRIDRLARGDRPLLTLVEGRLGLTPEGEQALAR
jgi:hypothetical protein